jgi:hypothetical protein
MLPSDRELTSAYWPPSPSKQSLSISAVFKCLVEVVFCVRHLHHLSRAKMAGFQLEERRKAEWVGWGTTVMKEFPAARASVGRCVDMKHQPAPLRPIFGAKSSTRLACSSNPLDVKEVDEYALHFALHSVLAVSQGHGRSVSALRRLAWLGSSSPPAVFTSRPRYGAMEECGSARRNGRAYEDPPQCFFLRRGPKATALRTAVTLKASRPLHRLCGLASGWSWRFVPQKRPCCRLADCQHQRASGLLPEMT